MARNRTRALRLERVVGALAEVSTTAALMEALESHLTRYDAGAQAMLALEEMLGSSSLARFKTHPGFEVARAGTTSVFEDGAGCLLFAPVKAHGITMGVLVVHFGNTNSAEVDREAISALATHAALVYKSLEKAAEAADMARLARIDALTKLPNRRALEERYEMEWQRAVRSGAPLAVVSVDVDFFGAYNERYGHPAGDTCLQAVAGALAAEMRRPEDCLGRYGGEEFLALLPACGQADAIDHAERMAAHLRDANIRHAATTLGLVTGSFGVAVMRPADGGVPSGLLEAADAALYQAKQQGRNRVVAGSYASATPANKRVYSAAHNVPNYITDFIGRSEALARVAQQVQSSRLVTLTGPGGIGKTRLAAQSAIALASDFADGVAYVDLSVADAHASAASLIAQALHVRVSPQQRPVEAILEHLRTARKLLVFDNCETAIEEVAQIADVMLSGCANARILATSREPLALPGEAVVAVEPLDADEAVSLFLNRSRLANARESHAIPVAELRKVCERLDRLPFAIELAASQPFDSVQAYATDAASGVATWRKRGAQSRQRSLFELIEWSYSRLAPAEQRAFRFLSVVAGTFEVEDASAICGLDGGATATVVGSLVRKSLICDEPAGRRRMLELTAEYGRTMVRQAGEYDAARMRQAEHYRALAERIDRAFADGHTELAKTLLRNAGANLYLALDWLLGNERMVNQGSQMAANLALSWEFHGLLREGRMWLERALAHEPALQPAVTAKLHYGIAVLSNAQGEAAPLIRHGERALALHRELGDGVAAGHDRRVLAIGKMLEGQFDEAERLLEESIEVFERIGYLRGIAAGHMNLGLIAMDWKGDFAAAERHFERGMALYRQQEPSFPLAIALMNLGELAFHRSDFETAVAHEREASIILRDLKQPFLAVAQGMLGRALTAQNLLEPAFESLRNALEGYRDLHNPAFLSATLHYFASWLRASGYTENAVRLLGFTDAYRARENVRPATAGAQADAELRAFLADALGATRYSALYNEGAAADLATAYRYCDPESQAVAS